MENLLKAEDAISMADKHTDRGRCISGWESLSKRDEGHDWCMLKLTESSVISVFGIDTAHLLGDHASMALIKACYALNIDDSKSSS